MSEQEIRKAQARFERAFARSEAARAERDRLVGQALADGWTHARIAEATGLTRGRVGQMAQARARADADSKAE